MINNFTKKGIVQKIIVILIFLTIFNFLYPYMPVYSADSLAEQDEEIPGGVLLTPITSLITSLCEAVIAVCQKYLLGMGASTIHVTSDEVSTFWATVVGGIAGAAGGAIAVFGLAISGPVGWVIGLSAAGTALGSYAIASYENSTLPDDYYLPLYAISPQEIFADAIPALHINFINPTTYEDEGLVDADGNPIEDENNRQLTRNSAKELAPIISRWYVAIRNLVLVGLMVVLLYMGIRIVISSTATEKAKYKEHITDWIVAVVIVVFMHYIMAFALNITEYITEMLDSRNSQGVVYPIPDFDLSKVQDEEARTILSNLMDENGTLIYPTNLMGWARIQSQLESRDENGNEIMTWEKAGYVIIYAVLTIYTVMFLIIYLKRLVYMAFLTIIAPLVALTYPIDKLSDGQAQAFNMWLKEYIFNLLLQPFHLLIYTVLVGSAMQLAESNMLYAIVAIGFILPAEKLLRSFFGFEKASTTGTIMGGAVGGAMAMAAINRIGKLGNIGKNKEQKEEEDTDVRTADENGDNLLASTFGAGLGSGQDTEDGDEGEEGATPRTTDNIGDGTPPPPLSPDQQANGNGNGNGNGQNRPVNTSRSRQQLEKALKALGWSDEQIAEALNGGQGAGQARQQQIRQAQGSGNPPRVPISSSRPSQRQMPTRTRGQKLKGIAKVAGKYVRKGGASALKKAPGVIGKAYGAAALGAMGAIAGISTGDLSNIATYTGTAGAVGYATGGALGDAATNMATSVATGVPNTARRLQNEYIDEVYGDDASAIKNARLDEKFLKDKEAREKYELAFGKDGRDEAMQKAIDYRRYGVTDDNMIIKAMKLDGGKYGEEDLGDASSNKRISYAKIASTAKTEKDLQDYGKRLAENGVSEDRIKQINRVIRGMQKT